MEFTFRLNTATLIAPLWFNIPKNCPRCEYVWTFRKIPLLFWFLLAYCSICEVRPLAHESECVDR